MANSFSVTGNLHTDENKIEPVKMLKEVKWLGYVKENAHNVGYWNI